MQHKDDKTKNHYQRSQRLAGSSWTSNQTVRHERTSHAQQSVDGKGVCMKTYPGETPTPSTLFVSTRTAEATGQTASSSTTAACTRLCRSTTTLQQLTALTVNTGLMLALTCASRQNPEETRTKLLQASQDKSVTGKHPQPRCFSFGDDTLPQ